MKVLNFVLAMMLVFCFVGTASASSYGDTYGPMYDKDSECLYSDCQVAPVNEDTRWVEGLEGKDIIGKGKYIFALPNCAPCEAEEVVVITPPVAKLAPLTFVVHFDFDKSNIKADQVQILKDAFAYAEKGGAATIKLTSFCDFRGGNEYNVGLGLRRANAVKAWFDNEGLEGIAYVVENNGKFKSLIRALTSVGFCKECWSDRRVEITVE